MPAKKTKSKKNDSKYGFLSATKVKIGSNTYEANEVFYVEQKTAEFLIGSHFYKKGTLKRVKD